jgi:hypothetical protein
LPGIPKGDLIPVCEEIMTRKIIPATELAEFIYCAKAWQLKFIECAEPSKEARQLQIKGNFWHVAQGEALARSDSFRWGAYAALGLAILLFVFCWLGWAR